MSEEKIFIQPAELLHDSFRLGVKILESEFLPDYIVAIWRGGTPIGIAIQEQGNPRLWTTVPKSLHAD